MVDALEVKPKKWMVISCLGKERRMPAEQALPGDCRVAVEWRVKHNLDHAVDLPVDGSQRVSTPGRRAMDERADIFRSSLSNCAGLDCIPRKHHQAGLVVQDPANAAQTFPNTPWARLTLAKVSECPRL